VECSFHFFFPSVRGFLESIPSVVSSFGRSLDIEHNVFFLAKINLLNFIVKRTYFSFFRKLLAPASPT
jgi:hypothetical protein